MTSKQKETIQKLQEEYGKAIWISPIKNQFIQYVVYYYGFIIGESSCNYETMKKNIELYYK